ncbi:hypothetical protein [Tenacibaculum aestuarii]|uniref:hypothetical protein n=1 Tax=Tenacibaculum aestuarii TaxID=362781 RepID=UPI003893D8DD
MKKQILIALNIMFFFMLGCSSEGNSIDPVKVEPKLPIKKIYTHNNSSSINQYTYDDQFRLKKNFYSNNVDDYYEFNYLENKLLSIYKYDNKELIVKTLFTYNEGNIVKSETYNLNLLNTVYYEYDSSNRLVKVRNVNDTPNSTDWIITFEYLENDKVKIVYKDTEYHIIQYENIKKSPFSAVPYFEAYLRSSIFRATFALGDEIKTLPPINVFIKTKSYIDNQLFFENTYTNTYDADGFLIKQVKTSPNTQSIVTEEYTYNK